MPWRAMAMPQRPVVIDMKLSEPNVGLVYPLIMSKHALMSTANWRDEMIEGKMLEGLNDRGVNKSGLKDRGLNE